MIVSPIAGWLADRVGARLDLIAGCLATALSFSLMALAHGDQVDVYVAAA